MKKIKKREIAEKKKPVDIKRNRITNYILIAVILIFIIGFIIVYFLPKEILPGPSLDKVLDLSFDEGTGATAYDSSGFGNNGSLINGVAWTSGIAGTALKFDGIDDYVDLGAIDTTSYSAMTIAMWIKAPSSLTSIAVLGKPNGYEVCYISRFDSGKFFCLFDGISADNGATQDSVTSINDNLWHYVVGTNNGTTTRLYIDGVLENSYSETFAGGGDSGNGYIGAVSGASQFFNGAIDEVKIWKRALGDVEIMQMYNSVVLSEKILELHMDENTGSTAYDSSGYGNNGTLNNTSWTAGIRGNALSFNKTSYIDFPSSLNINNAITMSAWVYPLSSSTQFIISDRTPCTSEGFSLKNNGVAGNINGDFNLNINPLPINTWSYLTASYNGSAVKIYVNGIEANSTERTGNIVKADRLRIGIRELLGECNPPGVAGFNGTIDEIEIWNKALTGEEIMSKYNSNKPVCNNNGIIDAGETCLNCPGDAGDCASDFVISSSITNNSVLNTKFITFRILSTQNLSECKISFDSGATNRTMNLLNSTYANYSYAFSSDGNQISKFWCKNFTNIIKQLDIRFSIDTAGPWVSLISPANNAGFTTANVVQFKFNATDAGIIARCALVKNGAEAVSSSDITKGIVNNINYSDFSARIHSAYIACYDVAGNSNNSAQINITISCPSGYQNCNGVCAVSCGGGGGGEGGTCTETCVNKNLSCGNQIICGNLTNCGPCLEGKICSAGKCVNNSGGAGTCTPNCADKSCGDNGCGGSCGACVEGESCNVGVCETTSGGSIFWYVIAGLLTPIIILIIVIIIIILREKRKQAGNSGKSSSNLSSINPGHGSGPGGQPSFPPKPVFRNIGEPQFSPRSESL